MDRPCFGLFSNQHPAEICVCLCHASACSFLEDLYSIQFNAVPDLVLSGPGLDIYILLY